MLFIRLALPLGILQNIWMEGDTISFCFRYLALRKNSGATQWSVVQLVKLVAPDGVGEFFGEWAVACGVGASRALPAGALALHLAQEPFDMREGICPFGPLLLRSRLLGGVSQRGICDTAGYSVRNTSLVETGRREPNATIALKMVAATHLDVGEFFTVLSGWC